MRKLKVVVCGTSYGQTYIKTLSEENEFFELVGIVARGSENSVKTAEKYGVPLFRDVDEIPADTDIACVALKSSIQGGDGTKVALTLLEKGVNVIQEHPVHPGDISRTLDMASKSGCCYHVNSHFVNVEPVQLFIKYVEEAVKKETPLFIEGTTSLSYSFVDILHTALGGYEPFGFGQINPWHSELTEKIHGKKIPFRSLNGVIKGVPLILNMQNFFDSGSGGDSNLLIKHRITIGFYSGNITLQNSFGPVIWSKGCYRREEDIFNEKENYPTSVSFSGKNSPGVTEIMENYWTDGIYNALLNMRSDILKNGEVKGQSPEDITGVSKVWMEIIRKFGNPEAVFFPDIMKPYPDPLEFQNSL